MNLTNYYWYFQSAIPSRICDDIVKYGKSIQDQMAVTGGYGDSKKLRNAIVAHSNALEHLIPFALILYVLAAQNTSQTLVQGLAISFFVLRLIHALGVTQFLFRAWQISSALSYALTLFSSCLILYNWV